MGNRYIYFYPHSFFRDRQLDTIRNWSDKDGIAINRDVFESKSGQQYTSHQMLGNRKTFLGYLKKIPLINLKTRPADIGRDVIVYSWGGIILTGKYILDLDNPYALTGYNLSAMRLYKAVIRKLLESDRCLEIFCMSKACKKSLEVLFGEIVASKSKVVYPYAEQQVSLPVSKRKDETRFLFVSTQFEIKGGRALLRAFKELRKKFPNTRLDMITRLPAQYFAGLADHDGVYVHEPNFSREEIRDHFIKRSDVLLHPTYVDSFAMVILEAISCGIPVIATDVYAIREMVEDNVNGYLLEPPISIWDGVKPSEYFYRIDDILTVINKLDTSSFEHELLLAMEKMHLDEHMLRRFSEVSFRKAQEMQNQRVLVLSDQGKVHK